MEISLSERIKRYLEKRPDTFVNGRDIEELAMQAGYKASNASRRCRELAEEGFIDREERKGRGCRSVFYKYHSYL
jgi:DNA-binding MarR family transcriptional regulator